MLELAIFSLALKSEALSYANRTSEAPRQFEEAEAVAERFEVRWWCAELHRLRGVFLAALVLARPRLRLRSAKPLESQKSKKSISLARARGSNTTQNTTAKRRAPLGGNEVRLPLC